MAELESEGTKTRGGVADFLREFADELDQTDRRLSEGRDRSTTTSTATESGTADRSGTTEGEATRNPNRITLIVGGDSATVVVPEEVDFDVEVDSRSPMLGSGVRQEIGLSLAWDVEHPEETTDDLIQIE